MAGGAEEKRDQLCSGQKAAVQFPHWVHGGGKSATQNRHTGAGRGGRRRGQARHRKAQPKGDRGCGLAPLKGVPSVIPGAQRVNRGPSASPRQRTARQRRRQAPSAATSPMTTKSRVGPPRRRTGGSPPPFTTTAETVGCGATACRRLRRGGGRPLHGAWTATEAIRPPRRRLRWWP